MLIAFRVDASHHIGAGHGMRCHTLAKSLKTMLQNWVPDIQMTFVATKGANLLLGLIREEGFGYIEVDAIASSVAHIPADLWIIDHYQLDQRFESELVNAGKKVMVIDDLTVTIVATYYWIAILRITLRNGISTLFQKNAKCS